MSAGWILAVTADLHMRSKNRAAPVGFGFGGCLVRTQSHNRGMGTPAQGTYTAKLTDGPLEGKTVTTEFLESGDPRPRLEIPADKGKRYLYARSAGLEFDSPEHPDKPSAVDYRYLEALFDAPPATT